MLSEMLADEVEHCSLFQRAMPTRNSRPCRIMRFWSLGGWLLGFSTALMGRRGIWACTAAVEAAVHRHLDDQLHFLSDKDDALHALILSIREEELTHLHHAEGQLRDEDMLVRALRVLISLCTNILIWLSTWGDSSRMAKALRQANVT